MSMSCLIIDDEPLARQVLQHYVQRMPELKLIASCAHVGEAINVLAGEPADLLFLDIKMPRISGIDFIRSLPHPPAVIFTTAFSEYAAVSYDLNAVDYLLKPFTFDRFEMAVSKALQRQWQQQAPTPPAFLLIKSGKHLVKLAHTDILYVESRKDYLRFVTNTGVYLSYMTMKHLLTLLPEELFKRIHRSYLINSTAIQECTRHEVTIQQKKIPVGDSYRDMWYQWMQKNYSEK